MVMSLDQWFPTGGLRSQSGLWRSGCRVTNNSLNSLLKAQIFRNAHINILCYISKTETQTDFCEVHVISIIIPIWLANQSGTTRHISYCITAKSHIIQMGTWNTTQALPRSHTYLYLATFIVNISH